MAKKQDLIDECKELEIELDGSETVAQLKEKLSNAQPEPQPMESEDFPKRGPDEVKREQIAKKWQQYGFLNGRMRLIEQEAQQVQQALEQTWNEIKELGGIG